MKEYPILMRPDLVRNTILGIKTVTRRQKGLDYINLNPDQWVIEDKIYREDGTLDVIMFNVLTTENVTVKAPYGGPGSRMYIRESWKPIGWNLTDGDWWFTYKDGYRIHVVGGLYADDPDGEKEASFVEKLTDRLIANGCPHDEDEENFINPGQYLPWMSGLLIPKYASRIWLKNTGVELERLQSITNDEAITEGIESYPHGQYKDYIRSGKSIVTTISPRASFATLWDSIHGDSNINRWGNNPWTFATSYTVISTTGHTGIKEVSDV